MRASASALVEPGGVLRHVESAPPLTLRRVHGPPGTAALCLVGSAAGPLAGDELGLTLDIRGDTTLVAAGATIAQGGASTLHTQVYLSAPMRADPGPLIICAGARVDVTLDITLAADATLQWHELLVLGRSGEPPGAATLRWNVTRDGQPLLRQFVDLTDPELVAWPGLLHGARTLATTLCVGPDLDARTVVHSPTDVTQRLADHATLRTTLGYGPERPTEARGATAPGVQEPARSGS
ncbi:MAG TPA: urease accessory protein UreD [Jatrophihabitantaceae bacterium]